MRCSRSYERTLLEQVMLSRLPRYAGGDPHRRRSSAFALRIGGKTLQSEKLNIKCSEHSLMHHVKSLEAAQPFGGFVLGLPTPQI